LTTSASDTAQSSPQDAFAKSLQRINFGMRASDSAALDTVEFSLEDLRARLQKWRAQQNSTETLIKIFTKLRIIGLVNYCALRTAYLHLRVANATAT
jgi:hypothetical protein